MTRPGAGSTGISGRRCNPGQIIAFFEPLADLPRLRKLLKEPSVFSGGKRA